MPQGYNGVSSSGLAAAVAVTAFAGTVVVFGMSSATTVVVLGATAVIAAAACAFVAIVTATVAAVATFGGLQFFGSGITDFGHFAFEAYGVLGQGVVEVHHDMLGSHFLDDAVDLVAVRGHHWHVQTGLEEVFVKFTVNQEDFTGQCRNLFFAVGAEAFLRRGHDVKGVAGLEVFQAALQRGYKALGYSEDCLFGVLVHHLVQDFFAAVGIDFGEVVGKFNVFTGLYLFHNNCLSFVG